jgi:hypothetical protein
MTWASITRHGSGRVRYAAVIEGWPEIWVTDPSLTLTDATYGARGRSVRTGLLRQGLQISERAMLLQGKLEASAMTFRFRSGDGTKQAVASFATVPSVEAQLADDLETSDTSITLQGATTFANGLYKHIGTEVFRSTGSGNITRGHWDTQAQSFYLLDGENELTHQVYSRPRSMEGRRVTLYVWGDGDDVTGYDATGTTEADMGQPIWRGIVTLPPRLDRDGLTWSITADHISKVIDQQLCARNTDVRPIGIHFPRGAAFYVGFRTKANVLKAWTEHLFWRRDNAGFIEFVNGILAYLVGEPATELDTIFSTLTIGQDVTTGVFYLQGLTTSTPGGLQDLTSCLDIRSHYTGAVTAGFFATPWVDINTGSVILGTVGAFSGPDFEASTYYRCDFVREQWATESPFGSAQTIFGQQDIGHDTTGYVTLVEDTSTIALPADIAEWSSFRIFIDRDWSSLASRAITVERESFEPLRGPDAERTHYKTETITLTVEDSGYDTALDAHWVLIANEGAARWFHGWLHSDTVLRPTYAPAAATDVVGFLSAVIGDVAANANDGNLPFIRDTDFDTSTEVVSVIPEITSERGYRFVKPVSIADVIAEELKLSGYMWSVDRDSAKLTFVPIPIVTGTIALTRDDDGNGIEIDGEALTPAGGAGAFPGYEVQSQGIVSVVVVKDGYDSAQDQHVGIAHTVADANLLSTHKRRALTEMTIAPKSTSDAEIGVEDAQRIAARMMSVLGREYVTVNVRLPFSFFRVMIGSVVSLTSPHVPNSSGTMGITDKRCIVIGRRVNLDPVNAEVELELLMLLDEPAGYAPSGVITGQTGATTTWVLTLDSASSLNILISPRGDGVVAETFAVDDEIRIVQLGDATPTIRSGTVTAQSGNTVSVTLTASWTPGSDLWTLEYADATVVTTSQRDYCFSCNSSGVVDGTEPARRFS